jgi:hypothetical protein
MARPKTPETKAVIRVRFNRSNIPKLLSLRTHRKDRNQEENEKKNDPHQTHQTNLVKEDVRDTEVKIVKNQSIESQEEEMTLNLKIHCKNYQNLKIKRHLNKLNQSERSQLPKMHPRFSFKRKRPRHQSHPLQLGKELLILISKVLEVNRVSLSLLPRKLKNHLKVSRKVFCGDRIATEI